jgi:hypothetical protein
MTIEAVYSSGNVTAVKAAGNFQHCAANLGESSSAAAGTCNK